jgi:hypothetical protein
LEGGSFDVITLWNAIDHIDIPVSNLKRAHRLLRINSQLVFSMPNIESWEARLIGAYWLGWDSPKHLYILPRDPMREILIENGFDTIESACLASEHVSFGSSLVFLLMSKSPKIGRFWRNLRKIYYSFPSRKLLSIPFWLSDQYKSSLRIVTETSYKGHILQVIITGIHHIIFFSECESG